VGDIYIGPASVADRRAALRVSLPAPMGMAEIERAYRNTTYCVDHPDGDFGIRIDESCAPLDVLLREYGVTTWAYVTACNPCSQRFSTEENIARHAQLLAHVRALELKVFPGRGKADGSDWVEESLLILGVDEGTAMALGAAFKQNAVVVGKLGGVAKLRWCSISAA